MKNKWVRSLTAVLMVLAAAFLTCRSGFVRADGGKDEQPQFCGVLLEEREEETDMWEQSFREKGQVCIEGKKEDGRYSFPGLAGEMLMYYTQGERDSADRCITCMGSHNISDIASNVNVKSEGAVEPGTENVSETEYLLKGTLYVPIKYDKVIIMHPIYQRADGSVYAVQNEGEEFRPSSMQMDLEGASISKSVEYGETITVNGKKQSVKAKITICAKAAGEILQMKIREMDNNNRLLKETDLSGGELKNMGGEQNFHLQEKTEYVMVTETKKALNGKEKTERFVYTWGNKYETYHTAVQVTGNTIAKQILFNWVKE